ncbi:MAG: 4-(cytidine 5'-diphospho)-2-C-methyl-D-erythritol kinase [Chlamydiae bacterium]|nr:4-(cytidine 5'-diphospho)-2-C-methyl-D-erythritol kinase [Chlamydiota bacterium]MBI3277560.1 4-(cytidine 5'-diphospho)-2-C-methyl-D-erythritol kinase [Chlamydiota bacterium]
MTQSVHVRSPAKVNLFLEVIRKREDGYHDLKTVFQEIDLCDEIEVSLWDKKEIRISTNVSDIPTDSTNLAYRAAQAFLEIVGIDRGVHIRIDKKIPVAAGLGGGSSNAAATLKALTKLFQTDLPKDKIFQIARQLGADVPFFLMGGTALGEGIGDQLTPLDISPSLDFLLVNPNFKVPTPRVYRALKLGETKINLDIHRMVASLKKTNLRELSSLLYNRLEEVVFESFPQLGEIKEVLKRLGAEGVLLSGSGPTLFALVGSPEEGLKIQTQFHKNFSSKFWTALTKTNFTFPS